MKKIFAILLGVIMLSANSVFANETGFNDVQGHWAEDIICKWQNSGYIEGYPDGSFKPDNPITRAELAKILAVAFDLKEGDQPAYTDVGGSEWYYPYLKRSSRFISAYALPVNYNSNIPYQENEGKGVNGFLPECNAIRMHVAEALVEIKIETQNMEINIEDIDIPSANRELHDVFKDACYFSLSPLHGRLPVNEVRMTRYAWLANKLNIILGDEGCFDPYGYITRAAMLAAIDRMKDQELKIE